MKEIRGAPPPRIWLAATWTIGLQITDRQYWIAKENGIAIDAYVQAGIVAAAYLQAKDLENYRKWRRIEEEEKTNSGSW